MNFPSDKHRRRMDPDRISSDLKAFGERSKRDLPTIDQTTQRLWKRNLHRSEEGSLMKVLHSLKSHPAMAAVMGVAVVAVVLLAIPISYTRTTGYRATLEISDATGVDIETVAGEFGKALDTENVKLAAGPRGARISAEVPVRSAGTLEGLASGFARALTERGVAATAEVEPVTERVTGNVYAMAANGIVEIRVNSEGLTDEEIEDEIRTQIEAAGFEACLVDVQTSEGEKRIEIGIEQCAEEGADCTAMPVRISIDGMEPPDGEYMTKRAIEIRIVAAGKTLEEAEAEARAQLEAMGLDVTNIEIEDCGDYYRVQVGDVGDGCCPGDGAGTVLGAPGAESKTLGEVKEEFTD
ncbi:MAG: hypothetical protein ABIJ00_01145 [Candidatus Eisenbacteria bacterium]